MAEGRAGVQSAVGKDLTAEAAELAVASAAARGRSRRPAFPVEHSSNMELFRRAVVALLADAPETETARQHGAEAAAALVAGAIAGDAGLAQILRPDPDDPGPVTWTVACYQIGDLSPSTLRDFTEVHEAVQAVAHCPEPAHVAAELLASSASGVRWAALVRTGELLRFQLPSAGADGDPGTGRVTEVAPRWTGELTRSVAAPGAAIDDTPAPAAPEVGVVLAQILEAVQGLARGVEELASSRDVWERLYTLEQRVVEVQLRLEVSPVALGPGSRDLQLTTRTTAGAPAARPWRPGRARLLDTPSDRPDAAERLHIERLLGSVSRLTARGLAAARRRRAGPPGAAAPAMPAFFLDRPATVERPAVGPEASGPAATSDSVHRPASRPTTYSIGWCIDDPCRE
jgi:hypothetical protein